MTISDFLGRGWNFPLNNKSIMEYAEGEECIRRSIMIILGTTRGERVMRPDFGCGINELAFSANNTTTASMASYYIKEALLKWEPRIEVLDVTVDAEKDESGRTVPSNKLILNIEYLIKMTNTKCNLVYPFYLLGSFV
jgi:phage baseplate assembly protein W